MKVLLIDPPFYRLIGFYNRYYPLGLVSVGTALRDTGHEVIVYDADFNENPSIIGNACLTRYYERYLDSFHEADNPVWNGMQDMIREVRPDVVGITMCTAYAASAFHVAQISKAINPTCPVVVGGPHATVRAEEILRICPSVDFIVRGEGEITACELVATIADSNRNPNPQSEIINPLLQVIPDLSFRMNGSIRHNPPREKIKDLDAFAPPDRSLMVNKATYSPEDMGLIMTSRGCPFSCTFCATDNRQVRYRSIEHILREIRHVKDTYGTVHFTLKDDSFTVNKKRVAEFCDALAWENLRIGWECNTRVDLVNEQMLRRMKKAGCNSVKVGIESGSEKVLERMNKGITLDEIRVAARLFRKVGLHWTGYFLIGTPGETVEDIYKTLDFMYEVKPDFAALGVYEPFPETVMFHEGILQGLVKPDMAMDDFYAVLPNHYYKADPRRQVETIEPEQFDRLEREVKDRFYEYNKGFRRILSRARARTIQYTRSPRVLVADFRKYLSWR
ncbi:MAG: radical SAM protein [Sedimentisphaerales bacterium]|nr:radical SAM protein [Sedimentisphaerales bacterium]